METVLIIEDESDIVELIQYNLERDGFSVVAAKNGEAGLQEAYRRRPSLIILDLMLPGIQGMEVCRRLRQREDTRNIPLIILTAKSEESDIVVGLEMGADDYVTKPFSPRELLARVKAVLRRAQGSEKEPPNLIQRGGITIDPWRHEVLVGERPVALTLAEFRLLQTLASHPGRVFTRDQLLDSITEGRAIIIDRNVDVHIRSIRKKLHLKEDPIATVRGVGYKFRED